MKSSVASECSRVGQMRDVRIAATARNLPEKSVMFRSGVLGRMIGLAKRLAECTRKFNVLPDIEIPTPSATKLNN